MTQKPQAAEPTVIKGIEVYPFGAGIGRSKGYHFIRSEIATIDQIIDIAIEERCDAVVYGGLVEEHKTFGDSYEFALYSAKPVTRMLSKLEEPQAVAVESAEIAVAIADALHATPNKTAALAWHMARGLASDVAKRVASAVEQATKKAENVTRTMEQSAASAWCPDSCPFTGMEFFMWIEHPTDGLVPTYGGPRDSWTLPQRDSEGNLVYERFDHDRGCWTGDVEQLSQRVVSDDDLADDVRAHVRMAIEEMMITRGEDAGVFLKNHISETQPHESGHGVVYKHRYFTELGDALMQLWADVGGTEIHNVARGPVAP